MALPGIGAVSKTSFPLRPLFFFSCPARRRSFSAALETITEPDSLAGGSWRPDQASSPPSPSSSNGVEVLQSPLWKRMCSKELGIKISMIAKKTRSVLNELRKRGYDVYLVGGCVRDLIMRRVPKDFDIITTANLSEVKKVFSRCDIVGKRFPICHVHIYGSVIEVSSFSTLGRNSSSYIRYISSRHPDCDEHDCMRWRNCLGRDFTINGLMFNPHSHLVYDYLGGMEDIKKAKVRTIIPAHASFHEDCARILRAIRIAARLDFTFTRETAHCVKDLATSVLRLDKGRILMEMNYMLAYGSAEASIRLLWKFGLLELLLPIQFLFSNLDRLLAPDRPCHSSLWVAILAFHQALACVPQDPLVVATFSLAVHNGGDVLEAISIARRITNPHNKSFTELLEPHVWHEDKGLANEVVNLASSVFAALKSMTNEYSVSQAMARYPQAPISDLVFIPLLVYLKVCRIFECVGRRDEEGFVPKQGCKINYHNLAYGGLAEARHVFARVVFDTVYPLNLEEQDRGGPACTG